MQSQARRLLSTSIFWRGWNINEEEAACYPIGRPTPFAHLWGMADKDEELRFVAALKIFLQLYW